MRDEPRTSRATSSSLPLSRFALFAVALLVACIAMLLFVDRRLGSIEGSLQYRQPTESDYVVTGDELDQLLLHPVQGQIVYVPAYSHIYHQEGQSLLLTITLSVRNTSMDHGIVVRSVRYFDTKGEELRSYLDAPLRLPPLGTTEFLIERRDSAGGSGANFLVEWVADQPVTEPIVESIMIDTSRQQGISFTCDGVVVRELVPNRENGSAAP